ncbi:MoaD/ThiS family protein [Pontibacter chinhatensis]|uniref:Molybdopterin synthase sulfur carrier subunit n=1 Tax=Pontibacter chinhatensis TaxID=1436961 RepID=A0A1I2RQJ7_9BACT|nr:MoaD/ThiS family protein [Pontibacter chinhatensis]SFG40036.1 molybdopterin synthase sulfur carrier subunit [Pontibacter chinhatensis]
MNINVLAFGIAKDIFGASAIEVELPEAGTVTDLRSKLEEKYPRLKQLASYMIAVNDAYAADGDALQQQDEVAIIPPVSGG